MVCWYCANANIELAKIFYNSNEPRRPLCSKISSSKWCYWSQGVFYDIPDPCEPIGEHGCIFIEKGYDIRGDMVD